MPENIGVASDAMSRRVAAVLEENRHIVRALRGALIERDATVRSLAVAFGATLSRAEAESILSGDGGYSEMLGVYFGDGSQHFDHRSIQDHIGSNTGSDLLYKGALKDRSRAIYSGTVIIRKGAHRCNAYQTNRNILLSETAKADSIPNLEILSNDPVKCGHAASVGPVDEAQHRRDPFRVLQVDRDVAAAARQQVEAVLLADGPSDPAVVMPDIGGAVDPDHLGAHVRQQHRAKRRRADPGQFDNPHPLKRSHWASPSLSCVQLTIGTRAVPPPCLSCWRKPVSMSGMDPDLRRDDKLRVRQAG